jgi:hypothetical protein
VQTQMIRVRGDHDPAVGPREGESAASDARSCSASAAVAASTPRARRPVDTAFGRCSSVRNLTLVTQRAELLVPQGRRARAEGLNEGLVLGHARVDLFAVVEVAGERRVHVGER